MHIPFTQLSDTALKNLITEFVSSTDDNGADISLEKKVASVMAQLYSGDAVITYDNKSETCHIQETPVR